MSKLYDFYFSRYQYASEGAKGIKSTTINGRPYTYCIKHGEKPTGELSDLEFLCTDTIDNIKQ